MFGNVAESLLKMMGQSGNVPGAILAEDISAVLQTLHSNLEKQPNEDATLIDSSEEDESDRVALKTRAIPLIELLEAANAAGENVLWDS
jgi:hypothetical protein